MVASATDIITYVGVPLAVIGVLPILWVALRSLSNYKRIRSSYGSNNVSALVRYNLLSEQVEVEVERCRIRPVTSGLVDSKRKPSALKGGSWTSLAWETNIIGSKVYHFRYEDEIQQPQAEVEFEILLAYLLELGAAINRDGFQRLKNAGLWTSAGVQLMNWPCTDDKTAKEASVLIITSQEDSDGHLSLALKWNKDWEIMHHGRSIPYTIKLRPCWIPGSDFSTKVAPATVELDTGLPSTTNAHEKMFTGEAMHLRIDVSGLKEVLGEDGLPLHNEIPHLRTSHLGANSAAEWFAAAATALSLCSDRSALWAYRTPSKTLEDATRNTIPAGLMVLAGILRDDEIPPWRTKAAPSLGYQNDVHMQQFRKSLPAPGASQAEIQKQQMQRLQEQQDDARRKMYDREQQQRQDELDALHSEKLPPSRIAHACINFLTRHDRMEPGTSVPEVVEGLLYAMIDSPKLTDEVVGALQQWSNWGRNGGMSLQDLVLLKKDDWGQYNEHHTSFAYAACIVALIAEAAARMADSPASDIQQCLTLFHTVRLG